jgi:two-component system sensor histidine kinase KdpD
MVQQMEVIAPVESVPVPSRAAAPGAFSWRTALLNPYVQSLAIIALASAVGLMARPYVQVPDLAMLLLLAVVIVAYRLPRGPAVAACLASIAAFDFCFVPPYYTFGVHDTAFFFTFAVMLVVALAMTQLTGRIREQAEDALEREHRAAALLALNTELASTEDMTTQVLIVARYLAQAGHGHAEVLLDEIGPASRHDDSWPDHVLFETVALRVAARWAYQNGASAGWGTSHCAEAEALVIPLQSSSRTLGVAALWPESPEHPLRSTDLRTIEALAAEAALTFERTWLAQEHRRARAEIESEQLRTALLSSLSHDLRSPLASIEGAASSLVQEGGAWQRDTRREMAVTILQEARRMNRLITNLLDMVRVESGALAVHKSWQPLEEPLGVALLRLEERMSHHRVTADLPESLPLVPVDELLVEQVFINLLENAARHTPAGTDIRISAWTEEDQVVVEVADSGPGVPPGEEETIFRKFHRAAREETLSPAGGSGLGLTICRGIVAAHGGRIWLHREDGGGAAFRFSLPLVGPPMAALAEASDRI